MEEGLTDSMEKEWGGGEVNEEIEKAVEYTWEALKKHGYVLDNEQSCNELGEMILKYADHGVKSIEYVIEGTMDIFEEIKCVERGEMKRLEKKVGLARIIRAYKLDEAAIKKVKKNEKSLNRPKFVLNTHGRIHPMWDEDVSEELGSRYDECGGKETLSLRPSVWKVNTSNLDASSEQKIYEYDD